MNEAKWDDVGEQWRSGGLQPATSMAVWLAQAREEAAELAAILHHNAQVETLAEIGCGLGRLTRYLAPYFRRIAAHDTSSVMREVTAHVTRNWPNVHVLDLPYRNADAALVWGNLYDADWTDKAATQHLEALVNQYPLVLVQTTRDALTNSQRERWLGSQGDDWMLLAGTPSDALL